jgi:hypothetical protein
MLVDRQRLEVTVEDNNGVMVTSFRSCA